jgi:hypothetical protein
MLTAPKRTAKNKRSERDEVMADTSWESAGWKTHVERINSKALIDPLC